MNKTQTILSVNDLIVSFPDMGDFMAVDKISFGIEKGRTLAIVGESGSGKSLTALALIGLLPKNALFTGAISLNGAPLKDNEDWSTIRGKSIGMIFQEPMSSLNPVMKIGKQLLECISTHQDITKQEAKKQAIEWLKKVQLPEEMYKRYPHQLSGGQKQRAMIAMAMCNKPSLLIADEPTTALDVTVQQEVIKLMRVLQQENETAMIFITHDLGLAARIADDVLVMHNGAPMEYGDVSQVLQNPKHPYTKALLLCKPSVQQKNKPLPVVSDFMGDVQITDREYKHIATNETLLEVKNLRVWFPEHRNLFGKTTEYFRAVDDVSFTLRKGEVLGLAGESGCGKSTLSRSLVGLLPPQGGQIIFNGKDLAHISSVERRQMHRKVQLIFQDPYSSLNPRISIGDMLMEPMAVHGIIPKQDLKKEAELLLDRVHLPADAMKRYPHQFSGGQRQRIGIARALSLRPQLLICDESVSALDVSVQAQMLNLLKELQEELRLSYLFISHDLSVVYYMSDRVMVMKEGKIVEAGDAEQVMKNPTADYTRRLLDAVSI